MATRKSTTKAKPKKPKGHYVFVDFVTDQNGKTHTAKSQGKKAFRVWIKGSKK